jgi:hypothetical protein
MTERAGAPIPSATGRIHNYVGLYLLCFVWLLSISGLLLNNTVWKVAHARATLGALHTFTAVRMNDPSAQRDQWLTWLWSLAIDALAIGLIALVLSGLYLWWRKPDTRRLGAVALTLGVTTCVFFVFGLGVLLK